MNMGISTVDIGISPVKLYSLSKLNVPFIYSIFGFIYCTGSAIFMETKIRY